MVSKPTGDSSWRCKLADLLVITYTPSRPATAALLLQVKIGGRKYATSGTPQRQVELYTHWPDIDLYGVTRSIGPGDHPGGEFSFLGERHRRRPPCPSCRFHEGRPSNQAWWAEAGRRARGHDQGNCRRWVQRGERHRPRRQVVAAHLGPDPQVRDDGLERRRAKRILARVNATFAFVAAGTTVPRVLLGTSVEVYATDLWAPASADDAPPGEGEGVLTADRDDGGLPIVFIDAETPDLD